MFRRRDPLGYRRAAAEALWPRKGWVRALTYLKHRAARLPDPPERIARGIAAGVLASFTPLFGLHFILAAIFARLARGNILASLVGTFIANPLTYLPIALMCVWFGNLLLGRRTREGVGRAFFERLADAVRDLWHNLKAPFQTGEVMHWGGLMRFWDELFLPYAIGGVLPGIAFALAAYYLTIPAVAAWQEGRAARAEKRLARRLEKLRAKAEKAAAKPAPKSAAGRETI